MVRYVETFFRHRLLLTVPIAISVAVAIALVLIQPRAYSSSIKIWVDRTSYGLTAADNNYQTPAQEQADVITELLRTRSFCITVGDQGNLTTEISSGSSSSSGILGKVQSKLQSLLGGSSGATSGGSTSSSTNPALGDAVYADVSGHTTVDATGPQIITVTFTDTSPQVAASTAQAVFDQFVAQLLSTKRAQSQAAVDFYTQQVKSVQTDLATADTKLFDYIAQHPGANDPNSVDPTLAALKQTDDLLRTRVSNLTSQLDAAKLADAGLAQPGPNGFHVLDPARVPSRPDSHTTLLIAAFGGGLVAGLVIALCGLLALTFADTSLTRPEEVEKLLGLRVVGAVGMVDQPKRAA